MLGMYVSSRRSLALYLCGWPSIDDPSGFSYFDELAQRGQVERAATICVFYGQFLKAISLMNGEAQKLMKG
jgi:hypothetical protein